MKGVLTYFPSVQSHIGHMTCLSTLCVVVMLNEFQTRFKDFEPAKFAVSFITNLFEERMDGYVLLYIMINLFFLYLRKMCVN
jgi:hypothetical protein